MIFLIIFALFTKYLLHRRHERRAQFINCNAKSSKIHFHDESSYEETYFHYGMKVERKCKSIKQPLQEVKEHIFTFTPQLELCFSCTTRYGTGQIDKLFMLYDTIPIQLRQNIFFRECPSVSDMLHYIYTYTYIENIPSNNSFPCRQYNDTAIIQLNQGVEASQYFIQDRNPTLQYIVGGNLGLTMLSQTALKSVTSVQFPCLHSGFENSNLDHYIALPHKMAWDFC